MPGPLPLVGISAFLTLVRQVGLTAAKRTVKGRLSKGFLTKNADKINKANQTFIKNKNKKVTKNLNKNKNNHTFYLLAKIVATWLSNTCLPFAISLPGVINVLARYGFILTSYARFKRSCLIFATLSFGIFTA